MMRGDNDLFSVMNEMADEGKPKSSTSTPKASPPPKKQRARLIPEMKGYGENDRICPENGKDSIWNPYISVGHSPESLDANVFTPPTCPHVEVVRRRTYEKFKKKFHTSFNWIASNSQSHEEQGKKNQKKAKVDANSIWMKLPSHSILERYYFACKVQETFQVMESRKSKKVGTLPKRASVAQIANLINLGKEEGILIDPILLSTNNRASGNLFKNEIQFQFEREWKKATKGKDLKQVHEFFESKPFLNRCTKMSRSINDIAIESEGELLKDLRKKASEASSNSSRGGKNGFPRLTLESRKEKDSKELTESYSVSFTGLSFRVSTAHFVKLQRLFDRHNQSSTNQQDHQSAFLSSLFTVLARYDLLEGAGLQSSLNGNVFDVLLKRFSCKMECFASPFNCRYERFCSAFPDTDEVFGSLGSFFNFNFEALTNGGCFQANPPFASDFILEMCKRMEALLSDKSIKVPFMFIVFVPAWQDSQGWKILSSASSLVHHLFLSQKDDPHFYTEGTQHRRLKDRFRIASFDTSVFYLQNVAAKEKWPVTDESLQELKEAFGSNPDAATTQQKQNAKSNEKAEEPSEPERKIHHQPPKKTKKVQEKRPDRKRKPQKKDVTKKTKKIFADNDESQMAILSSLGISAPVSSVSTTLNEAVKITKNGKKKHKKR